MRFRDVVSLFDTKLYRETWTGAWVKASGSLRDEQIDRLNRGVQMRFPLLAPFDALDLIGEERGIPRSRAEQDTTYAPRLVAAWETWQWAGTARGILAALAAAGYPNARLEAQTSYDATLPAIGGDATFTKLAAGSWKSDEQRTFWSRFQILFADPLPPSWVSGGVPAESSAEAQLIKSTIQKWKSASATCTGIVILTAGKLVGYPQRLVNDGGTVGGGARTLWSAT